MLKWTTPFLMGALASAQAAPEYGAPMSFQLVRAAAPECEPACPEWIAAEGRIEPGTSRAFQTFLDKLDGRRRPVLIQSNGGSSEAALQMGRLIRARGLSVGVAHTEIARPSSGGPTQPAEGGAVAHAATCFSACVFVLAGGIERYMNPVVFVGVHQGFQTAGGPTHPAPPAFYAKIASYFREMGEDPGLTDLSRTASPEQIRVLSSDELKAMRVATVFINQNSALSLVAGESGLAGHSIEVGAGGAVLEAGQDFVLPKTADGVARGFSVEFALRRGASGVTVTFDRTSLFSADLTVGLTPDTPGARRLIGTGDSLPSVDVYPAGAFCRLASQGFVSARVDLSKAAKSPGQAQPSPAPWLVSLKTAPGVDKIVDEVCPVAVKSQ